jgi:aspartyl protease family protein
MAGSGPLIWYAAGLIGLVSLTPALDQAAPAPADPTAIAAGGFTILRAPDGQFYTDVNIGAERVRMLVDPGAPDVLLTPDDAARLGIEPGAGFTPVTLPTLALGPIAAASVDAVVAPDLPVSLLGRSFLNKVSVSVDAERMVLR